MEAGVDSAEEEASFVPRERSYTSGSLSDVGKKRKQGTVAEESRDQLNPDTGKRLSFRMDVRPPSLTPSRPWGRGRAPSTRSRSSKLWSETFDGLGEELSVREVKRQEVIFELTQGEQSLIDDLNTTRKAYHEPMLKLNIMSEGELAQIFGSMYSLIPIHEDLLSRLQQVRSEDGTVREIGQTLLDWLPSLAAYEAYCCNQVRAKALLDVKRQEQRVDEFLQLCQESAFSRKLDLWSFLDLPRSRLLKYPLLLREMGRHTPADHPDQALLGQANDLLQAIVSRIDQRAGVSECQFYRQCLRSLHPDGLPDDVRLSRRLWCHGELRGNKGAKLRVFLFERALVVTQPVNRGPHPATFQVHRPPIPVGQLVLEDLPDGETTVGGSIRGAFSPGTERARNIFRVRSRDRLQGQTHTLQASDSFSKQQWVSCIRQAVISARDSSSSLSRDDPTLSSSPPLDQIAALTLDSQGSRHSTDIDMEHAV
ncbi:rho guanine nucleotide exchange factor 3-like isoform X2 [Narcine bancroftii]|uniref:rho guanine nucleotide exchange factor 3-like isoform X2 n=1 Tax=Narcine bancroftii TaxID=1343680 RepID=UPI00383203BE